MFIYFLEEDRITIRGNSFDAFCKYTLFQLSTNICTFARRSEKKKIRARRSKIQAKVERKHRVFGWTENFRSIPPLESVDSHACVSQSSFRRWLSLSLSLSPRLIRDTWIEGEKGMMPEGMRSATCIHYSSRNYEADVYWPTCNSLQLRSLNYSNGPCTSLVSLFQFGPAPPPPPPLSSPCLSFPRRRFRFRDLLRGGGYEFSWACLERDARENKNGGRENIISRILIRNTSDEFENLNCSLV